jgi:hypothetical protein
VTAHPLARILVPAPDFSEPSLYVRTGDGVLRSDGVHLDVNQRVTFDTAFGVFAAGRWSRLTSIADLTATIDVSGRCQIELIAYANGVDTLSQ